MTAVRIEGVMHEFSSIPGVVEDATDIIFELQADSPEDECGGSRDSHPEC